MALIACPECQREISEQATSCPHCGMPIRAQSALQPPIVTVSRESRSLAIALACILGGIGAHKFYLNKPGMGVIYLLFCWTFIPAIVGFIEGLTYCFVSEYEFDQQYNIRPDRISRGSQSSPPGNSQDAVATLLKFAGAILATAIFATIVRDLRGSSKSSSTSLPVTSDRSLISAEMTLVERGKQAVRASVKDRDAVRFGHVYFNRDANNKPVVCGKANMKEKDGTYSGERRFIFAEDPPFLITEEQGRSAFDSSWSTYCS